MPTRRVKRKLVTCRSCLVAAMATNGNQWMKLAELANATGYDESTVRAALADRTEVWEVRSGPQNALSYRMRVNPRQRHALLWGALDRRWRPVALLAAYTGRDDTTLRYVLADWEVRGWVTCDRRQTGPWRWRLA